MNINYLDVSSIPITYMFFKKEYMHKLAPYYTGNYEYTGLISQAFEKGAYQNGALHIINSSIHINFLVDSDYNDNGEIVKTFHIYEIDLLTLYDFIKKEYIEIKEWLQYV